MALSSNRSQPLVIAFSLIGNGTWQGGINYQRALFIALHARKNEILAQLFVPPSLECKAREEFQDLLHLPIVVDPRCAMGGLSLRVVIAATIGSDLKYAQVLREHNVDLVFESANYFGWRFPFKKLTWIPDFQHRALPSFFSFMSWVKREFGFWLMLHLGGQNTILVSSESAKKDCLKFYKAEQHRLAVMHFVANPPVKDLPDFDWVNNEIRAYTRQEPDLSNGFLFLPNQYWKHKNHIKVIEALIELKAQGALQEALPVILTGDTEDYRNEGLFMKHMALVRKHKLENHFIHLKKVPFELVQSLHFYSTALINPSLFEGWSTTVEEAKAMNSQLLLSDIPVHREQAPNAIFFDPAEVKALAMKMKVIGDQGLARRKDWSEIQEKFNERREYFSDCFVNVIRLAVGID